MWYHAYGLRNNIGSTFHASCISDTEVTIVMAPVAETIRNAITVFLMT